MELVTDIEEIQKGLRTGSFPNEASVSTGIVLRLLQALGWSVFEAQVVWPEYKAGNGRVDFALCHPPGKPVVYIEVKDVGETKDADRQLFEYAFHDGVPFTILTDGQEWHFYLPAEQGSYQDRRVYKLDLLGREALEISERLRRYLTFDRIRSGEALEAARADYKSGARIREIERVLPVAWQKLIEEHDGLLLDLIAEKVEELCGYKPDPDRVASFLTRHRAPEGLPPVRPGPLSKKVPPIHAPGVTTPAKGASFTLLGRTINVRNARGVLIGVLEELSQRDPQFLMRFASRPRHGRKRRFVAQRKEDLYPDRPDLAHEASHQLKSGWWVGTNCSKAQIKQIVKMAGEVADLQWEHDLGVNLG